MRHPEITPALKVQILGQLGDCVTADVVADRFDLTRHQVIDLAANHGYPDPEKMFKASQMIAARLAGTGPHLDAPPPPASARPGLHAVSLDTHADDTFVTAHKYGPVPVAPVRAHPAPERTLQMVLVADLTPDPDNPRENLTGIAELADSMEATGLLQPILARRSGDQLIIVAGHRRHAAAKHLGWASVDVIIRRDMPADDVLVAMLTENTHRADLDPIEEARAFRRLKAESGGSGYATRLVAARVGRAQSYVDGRLALLSLPIEEQELIRAGQMNIGDGVRMGRVRAGKVREAYTGGHPHLGVVHPLQARARARCVHLAHKAKGRNSVGGVACGECWESVIRANEQEAIHAASLKAGRCGICDTPVKPMAVTA